MWTGRSPDGHPHYPPGACTYRSPQPAEDELTARQGEETNRRLYVLSVVTSVLAPTALITGFFGMNTGVLPWTQVGHGTALAVALLLGTIGGMLWLLRRNRLL
jgi:zinc transporter